MGFAEHVLVALFPLTLFAMVFHDAECHGHQELGTKLFCLMALSGALAVAVKIFTWAFDGQALPLSDAMLWATTILYMIMLIVVAQVWVLYVVTRVKGAVRAAELKGWLIGEGALSAAYAAFVLLTPWTHLVFTVTDANAYQRGPLFFIPYAFVIVALAVGVGVAGYGWARETRKERRRDCLYLIAFAIVPFIGLVVQAIWPEWWLGWPSMALAVLFAYVNVQNTQIATDALTGLNNRSSFDRYLRIKQSRSDQKGRWGLIMIDVDRFKDINDFYGHRTGDEVLRSVADVMKEQFGARDAFLARYGGDEFAIIVSCFGESELDDMVCQLRGEHVCLAEEGGQCRFSLSAGGVLGAGECLSGEALVARADAALYCCKEQRSGENARRPSHVSSEESEGEAL